MKSIFKKEALAVALILVFIFSLIIFSDVIASQDINNDSEGGITGKVVSGKAVTQQTTLSIVVDALPPNVTIYSPTNRTYNYRDISLNFTVRDSVSSVSRMWYSLDGESNNTITGNITLHVDDEQTHVLRFYANDSFNFVNSTTIVFFVNDSHGWQINFTKYSGGNSTNLSYYEQLGKAYMQNISNFTLENSTYGRVKFNVGVNLSKDIDFDDESLFKIAGNLIFINSSYLPELNQSATLSLYNLAFSNPRILINGEVCPATICSKNSYSSGILSFNVTHFSEYSSEETSSEESAPARASSGGDRSGTVSNIKKYTITPDNFKIKLKQGQTDSKTMIIKNTGTSPLKFSLKPEKIENLVKISETDFDLEPGKEKILNISFIAEKSLVPNLYLGKIIVDEKGSPSTKEIPVAIEVQSENALFDVSAEIPQKFKVIDAGNELIANIKLYHLGGIGRTDVKIDYEIKDADNNIIYRNSETVAVETQVSLSKIFQIPENTPNGDYVLYVKTTTPNGDIASATAWFYVGAVPFSTEYLILYSTIILLILLLAVVIYEIRKIKKHLRINKVSEQDFIKAGLIKSKKPEVIFAKAFKN